MNEIKDRGIQEYHSRTAEYWAKLPEFEGPLDILLHFVKEDELNIYDIPISKITKDFLGYIDYIQSIDIEIAGEFLLMASELMKIKAKMLIPVFESGEDSVEEDPRMTLVRKLLEYKRFKEASEGLSEFENEARKIFFRSYFEEDYRTLESEFPADDFDIKNLTIFNLMKGYRNILLNIRSATVHPIEPLTYTPEEQKEYIIRLLFERTEVLFNDVVFELKDKMKIVCTFIAVLQLALDGFLKIRINNNNLENFVIYKTNPTQN
ncbi:MAG: segregation/condensation protein A [Ignavibacteria bacterium]|nr:segregation/condensation protein A [Ignavibacteria bacterium]